MYRAAIIGFGGIARVHLASYAALEKEGVAKLVAVFDKRPESFSAKMDINIHTDDGNSSDSLHTYTDLDEMLAGEDIDIIDICLPTKLHKDMTVDMLSRGYHVLCEKPMATSYEDCMAMLDAAKKAGKRLMIGHCLRFSPAYLYLKDVVEDNRYGKVRSALFQRLSAPPAWSADNWRLQKGNFSTCLHDMSIHDIDMCQFLFGVPEKVLCKAEDVFSSMDIASSILLYPDFSATILADWTLENFPFTAEYRVAFEKATITCKNGKVAVYPAEGDVFEPEIIECDDIREEIRHFTELIGGKRDHGRNHVRAAAETIRLVAALEQSANAGSALLDYTPAEG